MGRWEEDDGGEGQRWRRMGEWSHSQSAPALWGTDRLVWTEARLRSEGAVGADVQ